MSRRRHPGLSPAAQAVVDAQRPLALALPTEQVRAPDRPVATFLDEGHGFASAAREHLPALREVGLPEALIATLEQRLAALQWQQSLWSAEQARGRDEALRRDLAEARALRDDTLRAAALALRHSAEGRQRLARIRRGAGLADAVADHRDLAQLVRDAAEPLAAIRVDAAALAQRHEALAERLQAGLAQDRAARSLSTTKELRDRLYTLCLEPIRELRAHADFAFRKDRGNHRRQAFASAYLRRRNRKARQAAAASQDPEG